MKILDQIRIANDTIDNPIEKLFFWYTVIVGLLICIPILFLAGFICGCLLLKNPILSGKYCVEGMF